MPVKAIKSVDVTRSFNYCSATEQIGPLLFASHTATMKEIEQLRAERSLLEAVAQGEHANQRQLSSAIGLSLGKTHYLLKELVDRGLVKVGNFNRSQNKLGYAYLLTPSGIKEKIMITKKFLEAKEEEYEILRQEIEALKGEVGLGDSGSGSKS